MIQIHATIIKNAIKILILGYHIVVVSVMIRSNRLQVCVKSKKDGKDQETIQSITTPDPGTPVIPVLSIVPIKEQILAVSTLQI